MLVQATFFQFLGPSELVVLGSPGLWRISFTTCAMIDAKVFAADSSCLDGHDSRSQPALGTADSVSCSSL